MKVQRFEWTGARATAEAVRTWTAEAEPPVEVDSIGGLVREGGDAALLALTRRYDVTDGEIERIRVDPADARASTAAPARCCAASSTNARRGAFSAPASR